MTGVPARIYKTIEHQLRLHGHVPQTDDAMDALVEAWHHATDVHAPAFDSVGGGHGGSHDRLERCVLALLDAEDALSDVARWQLVYKELDKIFDGTKEGAAAQLIYDQRMSQEEAAQVLGVDRQTVRRMRDAYVGRAALLAASAGIINVWEDSE